MLDTLGLKPREGSFRYSLNDFRDKLDELQKQIELADMQPENTRSLYQNDVLRLAKKLNSYTALVQSFRLPDLPIDQDKQAENPSLIELAIERLRGVETPHSVPPLEPSGRWTLLLEAEFAAQQDRAANRPVNPATVALSTMFEAYARNDVTTFNKQLADFRRILAEYEQSLIANADQLDQVGVKKAEILSQRRVNFEVFYNQFSPFYYATVLYFVAFVLGAMSWLGWAEPLRRASIWTVGLHLRPAYVRPRGRIYISGRPPVTNLYSSAVFIGWACVLFALVFEPIYRLGLGNIVAVGDWLPHAVGGPFLVARRRYFRRAAGGARHAVLACHARRLHHARLRRPPSWLACFGILYVLLRAWSCRCSTNERRQTDADDLRHALLRDLLQLRRHGARRSVGRRFVGPLLGLGPEGKRRPDHRALQRAGTARPLGRHGRRAAGWHCLAIGGNIVTTWSWFGVNELGVGLHAYGAERQQHGPVAFDVRLVATCTDCAWPAATRVVHVCPRVTTQVGGSLAANRPIAGRRDATRQRIAPLMCFAPAGIYPKTHRDASQLQWQHSPPTRETPSLARARRSSRKSRCASILTLPSEKISAVDIQVAVGVALHVRRCAANAVAAPPIREIGAVHEAVFIEVGRRQQGCYMQGEARIGAPFSVACVLHDDGVIANRRETTNRQIERVGPSAGNVIRYIRSAVRRVAS